MAKSAVSATRWFGSQLATTSSACARLASNSTSTSSRGACAIIICIKQENKPKTERKQNMYHVSLFLIFLFI
jgi:hypothetical protein